MGESEVRHPFFHFPPKFNAKMQGKVLYSTCLVDFGKGKLFISPGIFKKVFFTVFPGNYLMIMMYRTPFFHFPPKSRKNARKNTCPIKGEKMISPGISKK